MKRALSAAAVGFLLGYAYAFVSALVASKSLGSAKPVPEPRADRRELKAELHKQAYSGTGIPRVELDVEDMHDVLPTDDEPFREMSEEECDYWARLDEA